VKIESIRVLILKFLIVLVIKTMHFISHLSQKHLKAVTALVAIGKQAKWKM